AAEPALTTLVQRRLARLLVDAGKGDEALELLADASDAAGLEVRGDAHLALGKRDAARRDYADALTRLDVASPQRRLLELKLTDAGGTPGKQEARS
ncbi:MAG TPA: tetratricopeptide repeat protein, partial [Luteimonas sp.]|nr:tetratricopeptide repeat protein [Luteimonas sp.]